MMTLIIQKDKSTSQKIFQLVYPVQIQKTHIKHQLTHTLGMKIIDVIII